MPQSHLVPQPRVDKNGVLVTRHVRPDQQPSPGAATIPAPAVLGSAPESPAPMPKDSREAVLTRLDELGWETEGKWRLKAHLLRLDGKQLQQLVAFLPGLDKEGAASIFDGLEELPESDYVAAHYLAAAVGAYRVAREIDDAVLPGEYDPRLLTTHRLFRFARDFFRRSGAPDYVFRATPDDIEDLKAAYLFDRIGLNASNFSSDGGFYRALSRANADYERIRPCLPLLIAAHTAYNGKTDWYFGDADEYFWSFLDEVQEYPEDKILPIAVETLRRGEFVQTVADQIASGDIPVALSDGLL